MAGAAVGQALPLARECGHAACAPPPASRRVGWSATVPAAAVDHDDRCAPASGTPATGRRTPSTAGRPRRRSRMAVCPSAPPSSVATPAMRDGSSSAASAGRSVLATRTAPCGTAAKLRNGARVRLRISRRPISRTSSAAAAACAPCDRRRRAPAARNAMAARSPRLPPDRRLGGDQSLGDARFGRRAAAATGPASAGRRRAAARSRAWLSSGSTARRARSLVSCLRDCGTAASSRARSLRRRRPPGCVARRPSAAGSAAPNTGPIAMPGDRDADSLRSRGAVQPLGRSAKPGPALVCASRLAQSCSLKPASTRAARASMASLASQPSARSSMGEPGRPPASSVP